MKTYKVVMVCADKSEVVIARGLTHNEALIEWARMNRERTGSSKYKVHFEVR